MNVLKCFSSKCHNLTINIFIVLTHNNVTKHLKMTYKKTNIY